MLCSQWRTIGINLKDCFVSFRFSSLKIRDKYRIQSEKGKRKYRADSPPSEASLPDVKKDKGREEDNKTKIQNERNQVFDAGERHVTQGEDACALDKYDFRNEKVQGEEKRWGRIPVMNAPIMP